MKHIKTFLFITLIMGLSGSQQSVSGQNIFWIESAFDAPRLVKTGADGSAILSQSLAPGSQPQSVIFNTNGEMLYWNGLNFVNAQIWNAPTNLSSVSTLLDSQSVLRGLAFDPVNNQIYWTSTNLIEGPKIWRSEMNGQSPTVLIDFGPGSNNTPRSISLDVPSGKMYWTNFGAGKIQRADMTVAAVPEDVISGLNGPAGLAVDADSGKIFWTEMNGHRIQSANLDGSNITLLVENLSYPNSLSINRRLNRMAWTEMGAGKVKSAALDGTDIFEYPVDAVTPTGIVIESPPDTSAIAGGELHITPSDTTIQVQHYVDFDAQFVDSLGGVHDTDADWYVKWMRVGTISENGRMFAYFPGKSRIMAKVDSNVAKACLTVIDTTKDPSGCNKIELIREFPNFNFKLHKTGKEGDAFILFGLLPPFNLLNGTVVFFPKGSLHEDISIKLDLPCFARIKGDSVEFANRILNAVQLHVFVNDSLVEPYHFDKPISISVPFRPHLLSKYGIDPSKLRLSFAIDSVRFDSTGISHVTVDPKRHRIYALVEHFSTLALHEDFGMTSSLAQDEVRSLPEQFELKQNYPNPFNPTTTISYALPAEVRVELSIFNMLGQKVATLVSRKQPAGTYRVQWDASGFVSGIYLYRLQTDQGYSQTKKFILLK